jgi:hypothetical protein
MAKRNNNTTDAVLREHLVGLLAGGHAHADFDTAVKGLPAALRTRAPKGLPYSPWQILEHMRIAQWDILEFSRDRSHRSPRWPEGYWPEEKTPSESAWRRSLAQFRSDLETMQDLVQDPSTDLYARIPWGDGQTILREALLVADHNSYHLGELVVARRLLGAWR